MTAPLTPQIREQIETALAPRFTALAQLTHRQQARVYLPLPYREPPGPLRGNTRAHWADKAHWTARVRRDVTYLARAAGLRPCAHLTVGLIWAPGDRARRDEDNLTPLLKVCADALARGRADWTGLQIVPDDTPQWMTKLMPAIVSPPLHGLWLLIDPHPAQDHPATDETIESHQPAPGTQENPHA